MIENVGRLGKIREKRGDEFSFFMANKFHQIQRGQKPICCSRAPGKLGQLWNLPGVYYTAAWKSVRTWREKKKIGSRMISVMMTGASCAPCMEGITTSQAFASHRNTTYAIWQSGTQFCFPSSIFYLISYTGNDHHSLYWSVTTASILGPLPAIIWMDSSLHPCRTLLTEQEPCSGTVAASTDTMAGLEP